MKLAAELSDRARAEARGAGIGEGGDAGAHGTSAPLLSLERFLGSGAPKVGSAPAAAVLGRRAAARYARAIDSRRVLLLRALEAATALPGAPVDDGHVAPAGAFLHRRLGEPARLAATWLALPHAFSGERRDALFAYRDALAERSGISPDTLTRALPGAVLHGVIADLPGIGDAASRAIDPSPADALREALGTLLDLADTLTLAAPDALLDVAAAYAADGRTHRARRLLATRLEAAPDDVPCALALARAERERARFSRARRVLERASTHRPDDPALAAELARSRRLDDWLTEAEEAERMPRVAPDAEERAAGRFRADTLAVAAELYERHGTLLLENVFEPSLLEACRAQFVDEYRDYLDGRRHPDALRIGDRRFQVSIALHGAFNDPRFYANPFVLALMRRLLDPQLIVGSSVCATSLPGASDQHLHKDHRALFTQHADDEPPALPPVAVTTMIPLVALDERIGTTLVRKGSHRRSRRASERLPSQRPIVPLGSCFLMDLSLSHQGLGNRTERVRPIVNMQYTRRWFVDNKNFHRQRPLEMSREEYASVPEAHRSLFDWARQPGPSVGR